MASFPLFFPGIFPPIFFFPVASADFSRVHQRNEIEASFYPRNVKRDPGVLFPSFFFYYHYSFGREGNGNYEIRLKEMETESRGVDIVADKRVNTGNHNELCSAMC